MDKQQQAAFKLEIKQFTGSDQFLRHIYGGVYTEGVDFVATKLEAYWLLDFIFIHQATSTLSDESFQVWTLKRTEEDGAVLKVEDGNHNQLFRKVIPFTDFPLSEFTFWLVDKTLMLPSEY